MIRRACLFAATALWLMTPRALAAQTRRINVVVRGFEHPVMLDTLASWTDVPGTPAEVFAAARQVLDSLRIPTTIADSAHGLLFDQALVVRSRLAGQRVSWSLHCGSGMTGDYADEWRISIAYAVFIDPAAANTSRLGVAIAAGANTVEGAYKPPVACGTTGGLEGEIAKRVGLGVLKKANGRPQ